MGNGLKKPEGEQLQLVWMGAHSNTLDRGMTIPKCTSLSYEC